MVIRTSNKKGKEGDAAFFSLVPAANPSFAKYRINGLIAPSTEYFVEIGQVSSRGYSFVT
jgi:hypothetical protein